MYPMLVCAMQSTLEVPTTAKSVHHKVSRISINTSPYMFEHGASTNHTRALRNKSNRGTLAAWNHKGIAAI